MKKLITDMRSLLWFLSHPQYYDELVRQVGLLLSKVPPLEKAQKEIVTWCERNAISTQDAIHRITGSSEFTAIRQRFAKVFLRCDQIADSCAVRMGGAANIDLIYYLAEHSNAEHIVETGISYGWSSLAFLLSLQNRSDGLLVSVDMPYPVRDSELYVGCIVPKDLRSRWQIIPLSDRKGLPKAIATFDNIDVCHYDSDKSYRGRMWAYPMLWDALRPGGFFVSDDISDNRAFHDFCAAVDQVPIIVETARRNPALIKHVGVLVKP